MGNRSAGVNYLIEQATAKIKKEKQLSS